jgi:hypothetical protein
MKFTGQCSPIQVSWWTQAQASAFSFVASIASVSSIGRSELRSDCASRLGARAVSSALVWRRSTKPTSTGLAPDDADLVSAYYGLAGNRPATKKELAGRFGLSLWRVESRLKHSVATLLAPDSDGALSCEARKERKRVRISQLRRQRGGPCASVLRDLGPEAFDKVGALERELVRRYYGIAQKRAWSRRELAREFGLSTGRVEDLVNTAVTRLTGMDVAPRFDRVCVLCGGRFTVRIRLSRRSTCDSTCETELKRWAGRATARAGARRTDTR